MKSSENKNYICVWVGFFLVQFFFILPAFFVLEATGESYFWNAFYIVGTSLALYFFLLAIFRSFWVFFLLCFPLLLILPFEAIYAWKYGRFVDVHLVGIVFDATYDEAFKYLRPYLAFAGLYFLLVSFFSIFMVRLAYRNSTAISRKLAVTILVMWFGYFGFVSALNYFGVEKVDAGSEAKNFNNLAFNVRRGMWQEFFGGYYPFGALISIKEYYGQVNQMSGFMRSVDGFSFGAKRRESFEQDEIYVLVIGETARPMNFQLNGYPRETNPLLSKRENIISFSNVVSGWAWTRMSVPVILTRKKTLNKEIFFPEKSIVSLFSEAGFETFWLSTQSPYGFHDSPISIHAREADYFKFLNPVDYRSSGSFDGIMLPYFHEIIKREGSRKFIVIHTMGSHFSYGDRYPDNFDYFKPSMKEKRVSLHNAAEKERLLNSYDNSIRYTDYFIDALISKLSTMDIVSSILYISDHGELIFDGACPKSGHGHLTEYDHMTASLLWVSDRYKALNPEKFNWASVRSDERLSTENMFESLVGMAGLSYPGEDSRLDFFSDDWQVRPRYIQSGLDFDASQRGALCKNIIPEI